MQNLKKTHRWLWVVMLFLVGVGVTLARFRVPSAGERGAALGSLRGLPVEMKRAFRNSGEFSPIPEPGPGDWLVQHEEAGQTYPQFATSRPNIPVGIRRVLYIQPIGKFDAGEAPSMPVLREYCEAYYYPMKVDVLPSISAEGVKSRMNGGQKQLLTTDILDLLKRKLPARAYSVLGLTMTDLYAGEKWNFVFGQANTRRRVGVFSFARYHPSWHGDKVGDVKAQEVLVLRRAAKVMTHETGHMFGIKHCVYYHCNMNGANDLAEADATPLHLCPVCLRKMQHTVRFSPVARYRKLKAFYDRYGMKEEALWVGERLKKIVESR